MGKIPNSCGLQRITEVLEIMAKALTKNAEEKENTIQKQITGWAKLSGLNYHKLQGHFTGDPDLLVTFNGECAYFEIKSSGGVLSKSQKARHKQLKINGCKVYVVKSLEAFIYYITDVLKWEVTPVEMPKNRYKYLKFKLSLHPTLEEFKNAQ